MGAADISDLFGRTTDLLSRLGMPEDPEVRKVDAFLSGPTVLAIVGSRARGRDEFVISLGALLESVSLRTDILDTALDKALVDAIVLTTPCDAALSAKEIEAIRAARALRRPVAVVVTDTDQLGADRVEGQNEIETLRLRPLLAPEQVDWCFRGKGEPFDGALAIIHKMLAAGTSALHNKPAADALARSLAGAETAFQVRCQIRDREREVLRRAEVQGALDLTQFSEAEKVERLRVGDRLRNAFEQVLMAADATGDALSAWARSGGQGDAKDATATIEEAWNSFLKEIVAAPSEAIERLREEGRRLKSRVKDAAVTLSIQFPPEQEQNDVEVAPIELTEDGKRIADTSIRDLIDAAVVISRAASASNQTGGSPDGDNLYAAKPPAKRGNIGDKFATVTQKVANTIPPPLSPAERVRAHLVQGIRSRVDLRLKTYVDKLELNFRNQAQTRVGAWERVRNETMDLIRSTLSERYAWSSALGELQVLRQDVEEFRRTLK